MEDFRCKARQVAGSHMTTAPATIMFAIVVSRDMVRIALMDLVVELGNILNVYIQEPVT